MSNIETYRAHKFKLYKTVLILFIFTIVLQYTVEPHYNANFGDRSKWHCSEICAVVGPGAYQ